VEGRNNSGVAVNLVGYIAGYSAKNKQPEVGLLATLAFLRFWMECRLRK
jgi:hypothetical protein